MDKEDKNLVDNFLKGDEASFEKLLRKYLKPIYNFIFQLVKDGNIADDITQETFIKAWKNMKRFDRKRYFKTWIFTIAKNTAYDYFKKKKTIPFSFFKDEDGNNKLDNIGEEVIFPDEILDRENIAKDIEKKIKKIPEHYQLILNLHYKEDFSLQEISEILGEPYNTIKSRHQRALKKLKEILMQ